MGSPLVFGEMLKEECFHFCGLCPRLPIPRFRLLAEAIHESNPGSNQIEGSFSQLLAGPNLETLCHSTAG